MKTLVVYYSLEGNVDFVARLLAKKLGADTFRLETVKDYPKQGLLKFLHGGKDSLSFAKPALRSVPDFLGYDTVVLGAPVWAGKPAAPLNTLLSEVDFSGKRVAAFASSAGGSAQKTLSLIAERVRNAEVFSTASFKNPARSPDAAGELIAAFAEKILGNA